MEPQPLQVKNATESKRWKLPKWIHILALGESRKAGFGVWLFIVANVFLKTGKIDAGVWLKCVFVSGALIGFGSILDKVVATWAAKWLGANAPVDAPTP